METLLFLIIVGILSVVFGKAKGSQARPPKRWPSTNWTGGIRAIQNELPQAVPSPPSTMNTGRNTEESLNNRSNLEKEYLEVRQESETSRRGMAVTRRQEEIKGQKVEQDYWDNGILEVDDAKNLLNGVIWSEILGEPRSKKPYRVKRR